MKNIINKLKQKEFMQNLIIELVGDLIMLAIGIVFAYYLRVYFL